MTRLPRGEAAARFAKEHQVSLTAAARRFKISRERVRQKWRDLFGDEPTPVQTARKTRNDEIADLALRGLTATEIAAELDLPSDFVRLACGREDIPLVNANDKGSVTAETKAKILELARGGKGRAEIARETGVNYGTVAKYLRGHSTRGTRKVEGRSAMASEVMDRTRCGLSEAAAMFEVAPPALYAYRKRRGLWTSRR